VLACAILASGARVAAATPTVEQVVQKHLAWLKATDNYLAEIRTAGLQTGRIGTVFVDNTTNPEQAYFKGEVEFPNKTKRTLEISGTDTDAAAEVEGRVAEWTIPQTPFKGSFSMFHRSFTVKDAVDRLHKMSSEVGIVENPHGGLVGLTLHPNPSFLSQVDGMLESLLLGGSLPRGVETTIWFNGDGRIERMVLSEGGADALITSLIYLDTNMPVTRQRKYRRSIKARAATTTQVYPSLLEMLIAIKQDDAKAASPK
jgi:hypothetical protein